ncbi:MAG TPA: M23 family metallopeptidase [Candidatus Pseudomonas excrementavium]|uniref:M23 family metallopeptidase n=1 Tax=Halopseudomonas bauzanensis TaxID=653930 RepID=UPI001C3B50ED|nr:M23 family metallopeptidase [Halopseudomonas bauzanensis]HIZ50538.1 M23 family metallopeptidase [Candidatus Pseudomonas excrementavium]
MNIIILTGRQGATKALTLGSPWVIAGIMAVIAMPIAAAVVTWQLSGAGKTVEPVNAALDYEQIWEQSLEGYELESDYIKEESQVQLEHMTQQLSRLQTRLSRLDALGERLTELADLSDGEFNFNTDPGMGGPELPSHSESYEGADIQTVLDRLSARIDDRTQQLRLLEELMLNRHNDANAMLDFIPVHAGYISSGFGRRTDPITRRSAMHSGLDFAAPRGTAIHALGAGVVTFSGRRGAYGNMIEISHAGGYKTRYAHAQELQVKKGELVKKGQQVATVGSTGRSTGPHLHLEVYHNGMAINPARFLALK